MILIALPFCGFPLIVSIMVSLYSKHALSHIFSMVASILYGYCFAAYCIHLWHGMGNGLVLFMIGILFLPVLLPLWILASLLNARYVKKTTSNPGTARSTASFPALGEDENKVK